MKRILTVISLTIATLLFTVSLNAGGTKGKEVDYHHALSLCFQHSADHAKALFDQVSIGEFNLDLAADYLDQIAKDLERARIYNVTMRTSYSDTQAKAIEDDQREILGGHATAMTALKTLMAEIYKPKPDLQVVKISAAVLFTGASRAADAHLSAMKKLGIPVAKGPTV
jgi:hypothetical protein